MGGYTPTPAQVEQQKNDVTQMSEYRSKLLTNAQAAVQQNAVLDQMKQEAGGFTQGEFANVKGSLGTYLDGFAKTFGVPESQSFSQSVGDWQAFNKNAGNLARAAAHELGSRTGVQELAMIQKTLPSDETSQQGFERVSNQLQGINDYQVAKSGASAQATGNPNAFEADWNQHVSPAAFIVNRMSSADTRAMATEMSKTPEGRATLESLKTQLGYAKQHNLFAAVN